MWYCRLCPATLLANRPTPPLLSRYRSPQLTEEMIDTHFVPGMPMLLNWLTPLSKRRKLPDTCQTWTESSRALSWAPLLSTSPAACVRACNNVRLGGTPRHLPPSFVQNLTLALPLRRPSTTRQPCQPLCKSSFPGYPISPSS